MLLPYSWKGDLVLSLQVELFRAWDVDDNNGLGTIAPVCITRKCLEPFGLNKRLVSLLVARQSIGTWEMSVLRS